ncbi:MAG: hypothetical protein KA310_03275 [Pseudomonadales bacterium]|nr:hypothetical protein [Pseudomonadales bacterium]
MARGKPMMPQQERFATAVPARLPRLNWVRQVHSYYPTHKLNNLIDLYSGDEPTLSLRNGHRTGVLQSVACQSERPQVYDFLRICNVPRGPAPYEQRCQELVRLPLMYLAELWPRPFVLTVEVPWAVYQAASDVWEVHTTVPKALIVLSGIEEG